MIRRLRVKFVCINMAIAAAMLCVIFGLVLHFTRADLESESLRVLEAVAAEPMRLEQPGQRSLPYFVLQFWPGGVRLLTGGGYFDLTEETLLELLTAALKTGQASGVLPEYKLRFCVLEPHNGQGYAFVDISSEAGTMEHLVRSCLLIGCVSLLAFFGVSLALARWAVRPVDEAWRRQRQFVADASHELKTPLTVILTNAELLQNEQLDGQSRCRFVQNILTMSRQMRGLIENLLDLARMDAGLPGTVLETVDLSRLVSNALLPFEPVFFEQGLPLESKIEDGILVQGSAVHLRQAVDILLDNARKYAAPQGRVCVELCRTGSRSCLLSVSNPGEAIREEDLKNIFKRFCRLDEARPRGGYGLGLAIAQGIAEAHGGKIWAESCGGINSFFIRLERLKASPNAEKQTSGA